MSFTARVLIAAQILTCAMLVGAALRFAGSTTTDIHRELQAPSSLPGDGFPRLAKDAHGDLLELRHPPKRIASQALTTDEFLFAIVPPDRIVATSRYAVDPRYSFVADLASRSDPVFTDDPEAITLQAPDLALVSHTARADYVEQIQRIGIPTFRMTTVFDSLEQVASALSVTGHLTGEDAAAGREVARLRERIRAARELRIPGADPARVLAFTNFAQTLGAGSLFDAIVTDLGAINVAAEQGVGPYGFISSEQVVAWNPDWIVAGVEAGKARSVRDRLLADPGVAVTRAGREGRVLLLEYRAYLSMSHHAVAVMESLAAALYGGQP